MLKKETGPKKKTKWYSKDTWFTVLPGVKSQKIYPEEQKIQSKTGKNKQISIKIFKY